MKKIGFTLLVLLVSFSMMSQGVNQLDEAGKRHGVWRKNFDGTNVIRYEGEFLHGKEIGLFKFYKNIKNKAVLTATKQFNPDNNMAYVTFLASTGKVISEGNMNGKIYVGVWKYYQKSSNNLLTLENYDDQGNLIGERLVYYDNGQIAEKQFYKQGKLDGVSTTYSEKNVVLSKLIYSNGLLDGLATYYSPKGELIAEGYYKEDKKVGIWKYYENGKLTEEKNFSQQPKSVKN